ncbi:MAG: prepilin-type N-terminal cleavage/methylation domain-containing protein [Symploca sp. SIO3E6]|nr:prepilin-type N-terminal cleavage/methylation domain-containing protein [Caldora sp. SIO3E6]
MLNSLKFLLKNQLQQNRQTKKNSGFTLIELLVGMIIAVLVITPLLGFMINILSTDRKEQAKANSEQEIKTALDYITQDLQQAVYIYDQDGLTNNGNNGISDNLPPEEAADAGCDNAATCAPVLVFWKRTLREQVVPIEAGANCGATPPVGCDDAYVYSLIGYYLVTEDSDTWSDVARITRFEISAGVPNADDADDREDDDGFVPFNLAGAGDLQTKMKRWGEDNPNDPTDKAAGPYTVNFGSTVLIDYIDLDSGGAPPSEIQCDLTGEQKVPEDNPAINSFYACVNSQRNYARIYLRGNALARIQNTNNFGDRSSSFFPVGTVQVQGSGSLFTN